MKRFTNFILVVVFFFAALTSMDAQRRMYSLTITEPMNIAGTYDAVPGEFGSQDYCSDYEGELAIAMTAGGATTACDSIVTDLTGKIALIDRGDCNFVDKALHAQEKGAIGVLVCNNEDGTALIMGGEDDIDIPCFMISKADCDLIRMEIPTVNVNFVHIPNEPYPEGDVVLWGDQPGQGDFDGGMNGWTVNNVTTCNASDYWVWDPTGDAQEGTYGLGALSGSPTACNGVMEFNSDYWDHNECAPPQVGELISPVIDLSGFDVTNVSLKFFNSTEQFNSQYFVIYSNDGGATWVDTVAINTELSTYEEVNNIQKVPLEGCAGSSQVVVKFLMVGDYYYWMIDDVQIVEQNAYDMRIGRNWYAIPQNFTFPVGQEEPIYFMTDVINAGATENTNVNVNVSIKNADGNEVFSADRAYGTVPANSTVENEIFDDTFTPNGLGGYTGTYTLTADSADVNPSDEVINFSFGVTEQWFSKENGVTIIVTPNSSNWTTGEPHSWTVGNVYHVVKDFVVDAATFGIYESGNHVNKEMLMRVYEWNDVNGNGQVESEERTKIGTGSYVVTGSEALSDVINVNILDDEEEEDQITLEAGKDYLVMVEYLAEGEETVTFAFSDEFDYYPTWFVNNNEHEARPRYAYVWGADGNLDQETFMTTGFYTPTVRLKGHTVTDINEPLSDDNKLTVSPNPATTAIQLGVDLVNGFDKATIKITDVTGKLITTRTIENVKTNTYSFDTSDFAAGTYFATLTTVEGAKTVKFVVSK